jgi:O-antigen ligase
MRDKPVRLVISILVLLLVVPTVIWMSDWTAVSTALSSVFLPSVVLVSLLLLSGVVLSSLRLKLITADLGYPLSFRDAAMTLSVGQLAGTAFFQLAGQLIGRGAILSRRGIPFAATVVISGYERIAALSVSLLLAAGGVVYLFGTLSFSLESGGVTLLKLALGMAAVALLGAVFAWGQEVLAFIRGLSWAVLTRFARSFAISLLIQGTTLAAYVALATGFAPHIGIVSLAAACCIVMLAASLPISFGGWGLRELSAVVALQAIGLSSASALVIALLIGFLSLAVIAGTALVIMIGWRPRSSHGGAVAAPTSVDYVTSLDWLIPILAAMAVLFQIYVPTGAGQISINLADPVVILGAAVFVLHHIGKGWPAWRIPHVGLSIVVATAVIALSILNGWLSFGWTDWAFINKGLGWPILLCYGATGALIVRRSREEGLVLLLKTFAAGGVAIALLDIGLGVVDRLGVDFTPGLVEPRAEGLSQNANAFAFVMLLALAALIALEQRIAARVALMAVALAGVWFSGSRAAFIAVPTLMIAAWAMGARLWPMLKALGGAVAFIGALAGVEAVLSGGLAASNADPTSILNVLGRTDAVTAQHLQTIFEGWAMFLAHPLFGAGLGAYMHSKISAGSELLVIHSTPVWLLAETGVIGCAVFAAAALRLFFEAVSHRGERTALLLMLMLGAIGTMAMAHEMLYQRAFWLLLGAVLAMPAASSRAPAGRAATV